MLRHDPDVDERREALRHLIDGHPPDDGEVRRHQGVQRNGLKGFGLVRRKAKGREELARDARALFWFDELQRCAALDDRAMKEPLRRRHREQRRHFATAA